MFWLFHQSNTMLHKSRLMLQLTNTLSITAMFIRLSFHKNIIHQSTTTKNIIHQSNTSDTNSSLNRYTAIPIPAIFQKLNQLIQHVHVRTLSMYFLIFVNITFFVLCFRFCTLNELLVELKTSQQIEAWRLHY